MDWKAERDRLMDGMAAHAGNSPATAQGFGALHHAATAPGALDAKTKELIALAIGISKQCVGCIVFHVTACKAAGATRAEFVEMVNVCILMGGGPGYVYGLKAIEAWDALPA